MAHARQTHRSRIYVRGGKGDDCRRIGREVLHPIGRWTPHRKIHLLEAIAAAIITEAEAMAAHGIGEEELTVWRRDATTGSRSLAIRRVALATSGASMITAACARRS